MEGYTKQIITNTKTIEENEKIYQYTINCMWNIFRMFEWR